MAVFHVTPQRLGQAVAQTRSMIGRVDRGVRIAGKVFHAVKEHLPPSKIKNAAEKGLSDYEAIREKIRANAPMP